MLEFLDCNWRANGVSPDGRIPGKININTIWPTWDPVGNIQDPGTFRALCDPNTVSSFSAADVDNIYKNFMNLRTPGGLPDVNSRPFRALSTGATGNLVTGQGVDETLLRSGVFKIPATHPYREMELLSKIFNNVTTRSNVFAVWVTVGFFEVVDDSVKPAKLGAEIGRAQGRHVRHRMFAIIDRTKLETAPGVPGNPGPQTSFNPRTNSALVPFFTVIE